MKIINIMNNNIIYLIIISSIFIVMFLIITLILVYFEKKKEQLLIHNKIKKIKKMIEDYKDEIENLKLKIDETKNELIRRINMENFDDIDIILSNFKKINNLECNIDSLIEHSESLIRIINSKNIHKLSYYLYKKIEINKISINTIKFLIEEDLIKDKIELLKSENSSITNEEIKLIIDTSYRDYLNNFYDKLNRIIKENDNKIEITIIS